MGRIESVCGYIEEIERMTGPGKRTGCRILYRGEPMRGEFPTVSSRFLKVEENCLAALFQAAAAGAGQKEDALDGQDGQVSLIFVEKGAFLKDTSQEELQMFEQPRFFRNNYMLVSLKGAADERFLFLPGKLPRRLPDFMVQTLNIPGAMKKQIRQELGILFGLGEQPQKTGALGMEEALQYGVRQLKRELDYELDYACGLVRRQPEALDRRMEEIFRILQEGRLGAAEYENHPAFQAAIQAYNQTIQNFGENLRACGLGEIDWTKFTLGQGMEEEPKPEKKRNSPTLKRIVSISLDGQEIQVKNGAEAMVRTVAYILATYHPQTEQLKRGCKDWLAWEDSRVRNQEGYFRGSAKPISGPFGTIWVGTSSNQGKKNRQLQGLCQLAEVIPNTIFWYAGEDREAKFFW